MVAPSQATQRPQDRFRRTKLIAGGILCAVAAAVLVYEVLAAAFVPDHSWNVLTLLSLTALAIGLGLAWPARKNNAASESKVHWGMWLVLGCLVLTGSGGAIAASDGDHDGLTWLEEDSTSASNADSDGDGLCDGGHGRACHAPGSAAGFALGERDYWTMASEADTDYDGVPDGEEVALWDPDGDGVVADLDGDFMPGPWDSDADGDDLQDGEEVRLGTSPLLRDSDADGLSDGDETRYYHTSPLDADSDNDGLPDGREVSEVHTRPLEPDTDGDGVGDGNETAVGTNPTIRDTDGDGASDGSEIRDGTDPLRSDGAEDTDDDGLSNAYEFASGSNAGSNDTDADGMPDGWEYQWRFNITRNDAELDPDGDGLTNLREFTSRTLPIQADTDADGLSDGIEVDHTHSNPLLRDSDGDLCADGAELQSWQSRGPNAALTDYDGDGQAANLLDPDADGDGIGDCDEGTLGLRPDLADTDSDGRSDGSELLASGGIFDPTRADTDGDGVPDGNDVEQAPGDQDRDGLSDSAEASLGTNPNKADSDCDGLLDGSEATYWRLRGVLLSSPNPLLTTDTDSDGVSDGKELGAMAAAFHWLSERHVAFATDPLLIDTDHDGLTDVEEWENNRPIGCPASPQAPPSAPSFPMQAVAGERFEVVAASESKRAALSEGTTYLDATGVEYGRAGSTFYVQLAFGLRLPVAAGQVDAYLRD